MKLRLLLLISLLLLFPTAASAEGRIPLGKDVYYTRGTATAKESVLVIPYRHAKASKDSLAQVIYHEYGSRIICKADEFQGKADKSGNLVHQDIPENDPFQKTLDLIKQDAFVNMKNEYNGRTIDPNGWTVVGRGSAYCNRFYKDSQRRVFCLLAVRQNGQTQLSGPPLAIYFQRTHQGVVVSRLNGNTWTQPQLMDPHRDLELFKVFSFLDKSKGF